MKYEIQIRNNEPGATGQVPWASDMIGDNEPRSLEECQKDVAMFQRGDCGLEMADFFADDAMWRIHEVEECSWL